MFEVKVDIEKVDEALSKIGDKEVVKKILKKSSDAMVQSYCDSIKQVLVQRLPKAQYSGKYPWAMLSGVETYLKDPNFSGVHIMGDYRLNFFNYGTRQRWTRPTKTINEGEEKKKLRVTPSFRGTIKPLNFLKDGLENGEKEAFRLFESTILEELKNNNIQID